MVQGGTRWVTLAAVDGLARARPSSAWSTRRETRPGTVSLACILLAQPVAVAAGLRSALSYWRGPDIISFTRADSEACTPAEAEYIRQHAQLRGTMGGAGYLYPRRLLFPVIAWLSAAAVGMCVFVRSVEASVAPWPVVVTILAAVVAFLLPSRPYYYRDTTGGGAIVCPPPAALRLRRRAAIAAALARGERVQELTPPPTPAPGLTLSGPGSRDPA